MFLFINGSQYDVEDITQSSTQNQDEGIDFNLPSPTTREEQPEQHQNESLQTHIKGKLTATSPANSRRSSTSDSNQYVTQEDYLQMEGEDLATLPITTLITFIYDLRDDLQKTRDQTEEDIGVLNDLISDLHGEIDELRDERLALRQTLNQTIQRANTQILEDTQASVDQSIITEHLTCKPRIDELESQLAEAGIQLQRLTKLNENLKDEVNKIRGILLTTNAKMLAIEAEKTKQERDLFLIAEKSEEKQAIIITLREQEKRQLDRQRQLEQHAIRLTEEQDINLQQMADFKEVITKEKEMVKQQELRIADLTSHLWDRDRELESMKDNRSQENTECKETPTSVILERDQAKATIVELKKEIKLLQTRVSKGKSKIIELKESRNEMQLEHRMMNELQNSKLL